VRKIVNVLSAGLQLAVDDGRIPANPAVRLKLPRQSKSHKKFLTHEQVAALADAVEAKPAGEGFGLLILVLAYTGLRWGELSGLLSCPACACATSTSVEDASRCAQRWSK
jgi:integrase